ncbi:anti-sigma factor domain-containing protein [Actinomycetospora sp. TBRC 11914]|uniref:anti-sigma factor domain-containing protein n=1 Tax=Actinomycetospora sp. TBRC 11914 TaxID=2729387 RepID=UPI00145C8EA1|nr:anti-sigma factor [Actinomycetospora sp. TBRC 11914]NMO92147.1 hypothetical protein [Actinomycetospora sp. TBRC 11914]
MSAPHEGPAELAAEVVGRALRALEPDEEGRVAEHLRDCAACRALLAETHETMAALAHALPPVEPPPALRARILTAAAAEPDPPADRRTDPRTPTPSPVPLDEAPPPTPTAPTPVPSDTPPLLPRRRAAAVLALAAVVAAIVVFAARGAVSPGPADPREAVAQRAQQVVASAEARDPSVRTASLIEPDSGTVAAVVLDDGTGPRVVPLAMPAIGSGRSFVLWRVAGNAATAVGTMDASGSLTPTTTGPPTTAPGAPQVRRAYALSAEPVGTVPTRPSSVVASGPLV